MSASLYLPAHRHPRKGKMNRKNLPQLNLTGMAYDLMLCVANGLYAFGNADVRCLYAPIYNPVMISGDLVL